LNLGLHKEGFDANPGLGLARLRRLDVVYSIHTVGVYRWSRILTGRTAIAAWRADEQQGDEWYRRAIRAHLNCVENLPVYTATVVAYLPHASPVRSLTD
jgi:hypothetical protein